jgi:hypothetical protein
MNVNLSRTGRSVTQQLLDFVQRPTGVQDVAGERMTHRMGSKAGRQPSPARQRGEQIVDRVRLHRRPERRPEQIHEHELS